MIPDTINSQPRPKALAYTLTCIDANGVMHVMQIS